MKKVNNKKRLNNKGFTLVELLAVVVILALVMGIAATSMLGVMNSSRTSTLHSAAQTAASNLNNWLVEDQLATSTAEQMLGKNFITYTQVDKKDDWVCLDYYENRAENGSNVEYGVRKIFNKTGRNRASLLTVLGLNNTDLTITRNGIPPEKDPNTGTYVISSSTCSAIRYNSTVGGYEFFFNAKSGGKYFVASQTDNYAFSRASESNKLISD